VIQIEDGAGRITKCLKHSLVQSLLSQGFSTDDPLVGAHRPDHFGILPSSNPCRYKIGEGVPKAQRESPPQGGDQAEYESTVIQTLEINGHEMNVPVRVAFFSRTHGLYLTIHLCATVCALRYQPKENRKSLATTCSPSDRPIDFQDAVA
jgi:hypothetical protein